MKKALLTAAAIATISTSAMAEEFSIKGMKFGMSASEIAITTGGKTKYRDGHLLACYDVIPEDFTIGGMTGWNAKCRSHGYNILGEEDNASREDGMYSLGMSFHADNFNHIIKVFSGRFGRPQITNEKATNVLRGVFDNRTARWNVNGVGITIYEHLTKVNQGRISISPDSYWVEYMQAKNRNNQVAKKDF
jgi:hypothetical protein